MNKNKPRNIHLGPILFRFNKRNAQYLNEVTKQEW